VISALTADERINPRRGAGRPAGDLRPATESDVAGRPATAAATGPCVLILLTSGDELAAALCVGGRDAGIRRRAGVDEPSVVPLEFVRSSPRPRSTASSALRRAARRVPPIRLLRSGDRWRALSHWDDAGCRLHAGGESNCNWSLAAVVLDPSLHATSPRPPAWSQVELSDGSRLAASRVTSDGSDWRVTRRQAERTVLSDAVRRIDCFGPGFSPVGDRADRVRAASVSHAAA
jgi:hypothetical protein